jgi:hypothetical protein
MLVHLVGRRVLVAGGDRRRDRAVVVPVAPFVVRARV